MYTLKKEVKKKTSMKYLNKNNWEIFQTTGAIKVSKKREEKNS